MPVYEYLCPDNGYVVEVSHPMQVKLKNWGELCFAAQLPLEDTDPMAEIERIITRPPGVAVTKFNSELKNMGFTKLVKRDDGVYENVTSIDGEKKYMTQGDKDSVPHFHKKIGD